MCVAHTPPGLVLGIMVQVCIGDGCMEGGMTAGKMAMIVISIVLAAILTITFLYIKGTPTRPPLFPSRHIHGLAPHAPFPVLLLWIQASPSCVVRWRTRASAALAR